MDGLLFTWFLIGCVILLYYGQIYFRQFKSLKHVSVIELFPENEIYKENVGEDSILEISEKDRKKSEQWTEKNRGSVRIANSLYFTTDEFKEYKERILNTKLP